MRNCNAVLNSQIPSATHALQTHRRIEVKNTVTLNTGDEAVAVDVVFFWFYLRFWPDFPFAREVDDPSTPEITENIWGCCQR